MPRGRVQGCKTSKCKYNVSVIDYNSEEPKWNVYQCCSYEDILKILKENHNIIISRDIVQNKVLIYLN